MLKRVPLEAEEKNSTVEAESALTALLKEQKFGESSRPQRKKKRPGCGITTATVAVTNEANDNYRASISDSQLELNDEEFLKPVNMFWQNFFRIEERKHINICEI